MSSSVTGQFKIRLFLIIALKSCIEGIEKRTVKQLAESTNNVRTLYSARGFKLTNAFRFVVMLSNPEYLEKFTNLVDMAESFDGQLHDQALTNIAQGMHTDTKDV